MRGNEAANKPFPSSAYGCAIMIRLPSNHESHHHSRTLAICMPVFRRFLSRAVHPRFEPIRVVKSSTPRNGSKWNESVESGSRSIMDNAFEVNDSCYSSPQISKFRETREKKCRKYTRSISSSFHPSQSNLFLLSGNFPSNPRATKSSFFQKRVEFLSRTLQD